MSDNPQETGGHVICLVRGKWRIRPERKVIKVAPVILVGKSGSTENKGK